MMLELGSDMRALFGDFPFNESADSVNQTFSPFSSAIILDGIQMLNHNDRHIGHESKFIGREPRSRHVISHSIDPNDMAEFCGDWHATIKRDTLTGVASSSVSLMSGNIAHDKRRSAVA